jgi:hypothetical protein
MLNSGLKENFETSALAKRHTESRLFKDLGRKTVFLDYHFFGTVFIKFSFRSEISIKIVYLLMPILTYFKKKKKSAICIF